MRKQLFQRMDPEELDRYIREDPNWTPIPKRRRISNETIHQLVLLRRALQAIPAKELQYIYLVKVRGLVQEEARKIYSVKQQNISYRVIRASERIILYYRIFNLVSETQLRRVLFDVGFNSESIRAVTGVIRTSSQIIASNLLGLSQGSIRYLYNLAITRMEEHAENSDELKLLRLIERSLNQLREIDGKKKKTNRKKLTGTEKTQHEEEEIFITPSVIQELIS